MKTEIKNRLIALITSGEYKMGKDLLYDPKGDTHCPLGVLTEMAIDEGVFEPVVKEGLYGQKHLHDYSLSMLNSEVRDWAGITPTEASEIAKVNDRRGTSAALTYIKSL